MALLTALLVTLAVFSVPPVAAGTEAVPEIVDAANDQDLDGVPACAVPDTPACAGGSMDVVKAWIGNETATTVEVYMQVTLAPVAANQYHNIWQFHMTFGATELIAGAEWLGLVPPATAGPAAPTPTGVATAVALVDTTLVLTVPKAAIPADLAAGASLTNLFVTTERQVTITDATIMGDRAPDDEAFGTPYVFTVGGNTTVSPDTDNDGLNDTFEQDHFGNLNETGSGDHDNDGLTNAQEQALGTDPTKADTDGDGATDKAEVDAGTGPRDPTSKPNDTNPQPPPPPPPGPNPPPPPGPNPPPPPPGNGGGDATSDKSFMDKLTANPTYLGIAAGGAVVLLIVALIGIFGRWGA